jgi:ABC-type Zn uptake system ZnuABC Zn-binding protein ZnuA
VASVENVTDIYFLSDGDGITWTGDDLKPWIESVAEIKRRKMGAEN